jgi:hypothetical protein
MNNKMSENDVIGYNNEMTAVWFYDGSIPSRPARLIR